MKPRFCDLIITEACMLRCKMCRMWQSNDPSGGLGPEVWNGFIDSFADFVEGAAQVQFVGGEPLAKDGVLGMIRHAAKRGLSTTMTTNGYLIDKRLAKEIAGSGLNTIVFSLDSIRRSTHDFLRGREEVYDRVLGAIELLRGLSGSSMSIHIVTTIMQPNLEDILELAQWVDQSNGIKAISFQALTQPFFTALDENWHNSPEHSFLWPKDTTRVDYVLDGLIGLKNNGCKITNPVAQIEVFRNYFKYPDRFARASKCNLGYNSVSVNTSGDIFLCLSMEPIGNIRDAGKMDELWFSENAGRVRRQIDNCKNNCKSMINCFFEEECPG